MSWFKKENKIMLDKPELPDLPDLDFNSTSKSVVGIKPISPPIKPISLEEDMSPIQPIKNSSLPDLPSIPNEVDKPIQRVPGLQKSKFESELILPEIPNQVSNFGINELPELTNYEPPKPKIRESLTKPYIEEDYPSQSLSLKPLTRNLPKKEDSVYIRLDKFQATMEAFRDILTRIREIEDLLSRTKEIKAREEKELEEWEREIQGIKIRINSIDKEISSP